MSKPNCDACTDLREYAPEFVMSGVTENVATSLKNNTGFNPGLTVLHNDCEDLNDANDCLIGRKVQEIESLDVCDWKDFMSGFGPNLYELLKAIIMSDCGQWTKIESICAITKQLITPQVRQIGVYSPDYNAEHGTRDYGAVYRKNGSPVVVPLTREEDDPQRLYMYNPCCGFNISVQEMDDCETGEHIALIQYSPRIYIYKTSANLEVGDVVFYITRSDLKRALGDKIGDLFTNAFIYETPYRHSTGGIGFFGGSYTASNRKRWWYTVYADVNGTMLGTGEDTIYYIYSGTDEPGSTVPPGAGVRIYGHGISDLRTLRFVL